MEREWKRERKESLLAEKSLKYPETIRETA